MSFGYACNPIELYALTTLSHPLNALVSYIRRNAKILILK